MDYEEEQVKEVFAKYGLAMYQAQCVERGIAILLATEYGPGIKTLTRTQYDELLEKLFKYPLGRLITNLQKSMVTIPDDFAETLRVALEKRNWLAHHYFWDRAMHFQTIMGRSKMIQELSSVAEFLDELDQKLTIIALEWGKRYGVEQKTIDDVMKQLIEATDL